MIILLLINCVDKSSICRSLIQVFPRTYREQCKIRGHNGDRGHCAVSGAGSCGISRNRNSVNVPQTPQPFTFSSTAAIKQIWLASRVHTQNNRVFKSAVDEHAINFRRSQGEPVLCPGERHHPAMLNHKHPGITQPHQSTAITL